MSAIAILAIIATVLLAGMYLLFCWKVYDRSGDVEALKEAIKAGRFLEVLAAPLRQAAKPAAGDSADELPKTTPPPTPPGLDDHR